MPPKTEDSLPPPPPMDHFDYIIAGAGCAGLSLLVRLLETGQCSTKKILLVDKGPKTANDRTWCFWEKQPGIFEPIVHRSWQQLWVAHPNHTALHNIAPYKYKMIRAIDFYQYCFGIINKYPNVSILYTAINRIGHQHGKAILETTAGHFSAAHLFSSIPAPLPAPKKNEHYLLQHFKGWVIQTDNPIFNPNEATLMDFRVSQQAGTTFVYVMPFSPRRALVEYTVFSRKLLTDHAYDAGLQQYIHTILGTNGYSILEQEKGAIPMTNQPYPVADGPITYIGTAGGQTKASSGYTFRFIQKQSEHIVKALQLNQPPVQPARWAHKRFHWYDSVLLNVLARHKMPGDLIFNDLFKKNKATEVLQFLDNETSLWQDMRIIAALPKKVFIHAAWEQRSC